MTGKRCSQLIVGTHLLLTFSLVGAVRADAAHCMVSQIAIIDGSWEKTGTAVPYAVQTQDATGAACHVGETLRLSFASTGEGTFVGQTGAPAQTWIASSTTNRNFYYQGAAGHVLTVAAGYGTAASWSVQWQASRTVGASVPAGSTAPGTVQSGSPLVEAKSVDEYESDTVTEARLFADDLMKLVLRHPKRASVGQPVLFTALPSGLDEGLLRTLRYTWNFGDGGTSTERTPSHTYRYPGTYVVIATARRQGHEVVVRTEVAIMPVAPSLDRDADGNVLVRNTGAHEIELSGLTLSDGTHTFTLPDNTHLLSGSVLTLPRSQTGLARQASVIVLADRTGALLAQYPAYVEGTPQTLASVARSANEERSGRSAPRTADAPDISPRTSVRADTVHLASAGATLRTDDKPVVPVAAQRRADDATTRWVAPFALVGVLCVGVLALYAHRIV